MSTCGEVDSDVHALIKELAIRRVEHRSEAHSNESQYLEEGTEVARLRAAVLFCFTADTSIPHASPSLRTGGGACKHPTAPLLRSGVRTRPSYRGGNRVRATGKERTGSGAGLESGAGLGSGAGTETGTGSGVGTGTWMVMGTGTQRERERQRGWTRTNEGDMGTGTGGKESRKVVIARESVEFSEATPIGLADDSKGSFYGRETDRDLRSA